VEKAERSGQGLALTGVRRGLVIEDCLEKLIHFCTHDAYQGYDTAIDDYAAEPNVLQTEMLRLVNSFMRARSSTTAWEAFLGKPIPELAAIPANVDLIEASDQDYAVVRMQLERCFKRLTTKWIADVAASKMLYLKPPKLVAISDMLVKQALGVEAKGSCVDQAMAVTDGVRATGRANLGLLDWLQKKLESHPKCFRLSKARILDILLWGDMAIADNQEWQKAARENGWRSVAWTVRSEPVDKLYKAAFDAGCIKFGSYTLKSGIISPVYCDFRGLVSKPDLLKKIGQALAGKAWEIGCDRLAGIPYAGLPLGVAASLASNIPMIYPRKEAKDYGTKRLIEGAYNKDDKVLVIDDIITDGASKIEAIAPLKDAGLVIEDVLIILDREQGGDKILAKAGYTLHSLGKLSEVLNALVAAGKVEPEMRTKVAEFIAANQFA